MSLTLIPTPIITFQLLALLLSTAIEAWILARRLYFPRNICVQYAFILNLVSSTGIWLLGLSLLAIVPQNIKLYIISYVFFGTLYNLESSWMLNASTLVILSLLFWFICLIELKGIDILEAFLYPQTEDEARKKKIWQRIYDAIIQTDTEKISAIFIANALSNSSILLIILLGFIQRYD